MVGMAKRVLRTAIELYNPELNVLIMNAGDDNLFAVLAEKVPQSSDEELIYIVAGYRMDMLRPEPDVLFWGIKTLERAKVVYEELVRTF